MDRLVTTLFVGLGNGSIYALVAIGFVVIYKSTQVINFAQPALMVAGGLITHLLAIQAGLTFWLALGLAVASTALLGLVLERVALRPMVGQPVFAAAIVTLGIDVVVRNLTNRIIGPRIRAVGDPWGLATWNLDGAIVQQRYVWMIVVSLVAVSLLLAFFKFSRFGLAMRAAAFDQEVALAQGVSVGRVFAVSWAIAGALAALAGMLVGTGGGVQQTTFVIGFKALPAIILGGLDSVGGAIIGGLAVGVVEALFGAYQGQYAPWLGQNFAVVSPYVLMLLVLMVRPYGLFGTPEVERL